MPHLVLHLSPPLKNAPWLDFFAQTHKILSPYADILTCKSRINEISSVYIGHHTGQEGLIHLELALRPRPAEVLANIGQEVFECLKTHSAPIIAQHHLIVEPTLELRILEHFWNWDVLSKKEKAYEKSTL